MTRWLVDLLRPHHFRGKYRLLSRLHSPTGEVAADVFGWRMKLDLNDHIQRLIFYGAYEPHETALLRNCVRPNCIAVDIGANVGYYTAMLSRAVGMGGRVVAIEPSPYAHKRLTEFRDTNRIDWCETLNLALGDRDGSLPLFLMEGSSNHTPSMVNQTGVRVLATVPVRRLDDVIAERNISTIDILKIDVEGFEPQVLAGATRLLSERRIKAILCELNEHWLTRNGSSSAALRSTFSSYGFKDHSGDAVPTDLETRLFVLGQ